jgi:hypothetical protein
MDQHIGEDVFDVILCNSNYDGDLGQGTQWVQADEQGLVDERLHCADMLDRERPWRHDAAKLAGTIMDVFYERTGPLSDEDG